MAQTTYAVSTAGSFDPDREVNRLYKAITGRQDFSYNPGADPLYRQARDRAVQAGRLAMRDSMGSAAALTGGYASSYGQRVGQQQYGEYLRRLSDALPQYYSLARQQWQDRGQRLRDQYDMAVDRQKTAYQQKKDAAEARRQAEERAYRRSRDKRMDERYDRQEKQKAGQQSEKAKQTAFSNLVKLISTGGYRPTDEELKAAGLSRAAAETLRKEYLRQIAPKQTGSGGGSGGWRGTPAPGRERISSPEKIGKGRADRTTPPGPVRRGGGAVR